jgi:hypothetical protein
VRQTLAEAYGENEDAWWVQGVPATIRRDCACRREDSLKREELYAYAYLIDIKTIIEKNRKLFESRSYAINKQPIQQKEFLDGIIKCNEIRNRVMHTMHEVSEDDVSFLKQFCASVKTFTN